MERKKKRTYRPREIEELPEATALGAGGGPSDLEQQVNHWGAVAREVLADCKKGADAEKEMLRRRNRSGQ